MLMRALKDSFTKLDPREQVKNPVMFLVYLSALLTTVLFALSLGGISDGIVTSGFILAIAVILWLTCLFSNFAEAIAEGRGKAQADSLRASKKDVSAHKLITILILTFSVISLAATILISQYLGAGDRSLRRPGQNGSPRLDYLPPRL